jgi:hypothetical protein
MHLAGIKYASILGKFAACCSAALPATWICIVAGQQIAIKLKLDGSENWIPDRR